MPIDFGSSAIAAVVPRPQPASSKRTITLRAMRCLPPISTITDRPIMPVVGCRTMSPAPAGRPFKAAADDGHPTVLMKPAASLQGLWPPLFRRNSSALPQSGNGPRRRDGKAKEAALLAEILARHGAHRQVA